MVEQTPRKEVMSNAPPARKQGRPRKWLIALLLVAIAFTAISLLPVRPVVLEVEWSPWSQWGFGRYRSERRSEGRIDYGRFEQSQEAKRVTLVTEGFRFGPLHTYAIRVEMEKPPLGTNTVHVGDILYDPVTKHELWRVLATERNHEFDDDTNKDGVLVRSSTNGSEAWMPREKLEKVLVGR